MITSGMIHLLFDHDPDRYHATTWYSHPRDAIWIGACS